VYVRGDWVIVTPGVGECILDVQSAEEVSLSSRIPRRRYETDFDSISSQDFFVRDFSLLYFLDFLIKVKYRDINILKLNVVKYFKIFLQ